MPDPQPDTDLGPTRVRLDALDVIRGIAVLGILLMNIEEMGTPKAAWVYPPLISWTSADLLTAGAIVVLVLTLIGVSHY